MTDCCSYCLDHLQASLGGTHWRDCNRQDRTCISRQFWAQVGTGEVEVLNPSAKLIRPCLEDHDKGEGNGWSQQTYSQNSRFGDAAVA